MTENKETKLDIRIKPDFLLEFKTYAAKRQISVSALVRLLMAEYIEKEKSKNGNN